MTFPTVVSKQDHLIHIVKNQRKTECGITYHHFTIVNRSDLKRIKFIREDSITCATCLQHYLNQI